MTAEWPGYARFRPIQQWPGENTRNRRTSNFSASWSSTLSLLDRELCQLGAKNVVIQVAVAESEIRNDGYPRANARPVHPGVIVSLDSAYGPLSYPCDTFTSWQDNLRAVALALEALRAVDRYGVTKRGEQYTGWKQLPGGRPMPAPMTREEAADFFTSKADPFGSIPGMKQTLLSGRMVEATYKSIARKLHPDAGGSTEAFQRLQEAKRVLDGAA